MQESKRGGGGPLDVVVVVLCGDAVGWWIQYARCGQCVVNGL